MENGNATAERLRAEQVGCYEREDFGRYFELAGDLAATSPGYARSYECWLGTVLHALARTTPDLVFLQVGAMDGKRFDPIYAFVKHYRWRGLILEPLPDLFEALGANYAGCDHLTLVRAALRERDGEDSMLRVRRDAAASGAVPNWAEGLGTFHPERNALGGIGVGVESDLHRALLAHAERVAVRCTTLASLAAEHGLTRLDLLQVDAEGCELAIMRQVAHRGLWPRVVHLEHWALAPAERGELLGLLGERGYIMRMSESDVVAIDADLRASIDATVGRSC